MSLYMQSVLLSSLLLLLDMMKIKDTLMAHPELFDMAMGDKQSNPYFLVILALIPIVNILVPIIVLVIFSSEKLTQEFIDYVTHEGDK